MGKAANRKWGKRYQRYLQTETRQTSRLQSFRKFKADHKHVHTLFPYGVQNVHFVPEVGSAEYVRFVESSQIRKDKT